MFYYDVTDLINHARLTNQVSGIQRVILEIAKKLVLEESVKLCFMSPITGKFYVIENAKSAMEYENLDDFKSLWELSELGFSNQYANCLSYIDFYVAKTNRKRRLSRLAKIAIKTPMIRTLAYKKIKKWVSLNARVNFDRNEVIFSQITSSSKDDLVMLFGGIWNFQSSYEKLFNSILVDAKKAIMLYDLIPIVSEYAPDQLRSMFEKYVPFILKYADSIIVNSISCKNDLLAYIDKYGNNDSKSIAIVNLSHELPVTSNADGCYRLSVRKLFNETYMLCVGSIESRKNHINLLIMWQKFFNSEKYANEKLVIAGRWLWDSEIIQQFLTYSGHVCGSVIVIESPTNEELASLYKNARFTVYPSHYEGWGLPLGESLRYRKPCLHFDVSSLQEAGMGMTKAINYPDYSEFYKVMVDWMKDDRSLDEQLQNIIKNEHKLRSWLNVVNDLKSQLSIGESREV